MMDAAPEVPTAEIFEELLVDRLLVCPGRIIKSTLVCRGLICDSSRTIAILLGNASKR